MIERPLSPMQQVLFDAICGCADAGQPCPSNMALARIVGTEPSAISNMLACISGRGLITIERGQNFRVVTITATGRRTAGEITVPHWRDRQQVDAVRNAAAEEAAAKGERRSIARCTGTVSKMSALPPMRDYAEPRIDPESVPEPVSREPCFWCGTRGDLVCKHRRAA